MDIQTERESNRFRVDKVVLEKSIQLLIEKIVLVQSEKDYGTTEIGFSVGYMREQEWYKRVIFTKANDEILQTYLWKKEMIGSGILWKKILDTLRIKYDDSGKQQNLVGWREIQYLEKQFQSKPVESEQVIYDIFLSTNEKQEEFAFDKAVKCWGRRFPIISYLFFLKDRERFAVLKPDLFKERLSLFVIVFP